MKIKHNFRLYLGAIGMLILILDSRTALNGMAAGIEICLYTLVPSLFPFSVLGAVITNAAVGRKISILRPVTKRFRIPDGAESLLLVGWLGGYPIGAQMAAAASHRGYLEQSDAEKLAIICNNPGPAFLFGVLGCVISSQRSLWCLWGIQILSSLLISLMIPGNVRSITTVRKDDPVPFPEILRNSALSMVSICACVVFFRMILEFLQRWIFWAIPEIWEVALTGMLELSNGCILLSRIADPGIRLIMASALLSFGGICVGTQTAAVFQGLKLSHYLSWKAVQCIICASMTALVALPFPKAFCFLPTAVLPCIYILSIRKKKDIAFGKAFMYNNQNAL